MTTSSAIDQTFARFAAILREEPSFQAEFTASAAEFFRAGWDARRYAQDDLARRRHLEWFLLERLSPGATTLAIETLSELRPELSDPAELEEGIDLRMLTDSRTGVFEVTGIEPGQGIWMRDLAGHGEYPVIEAQASTVLQRGDLIAGRIFPVGEGLHRVSSAAAIFRNPQLLEALRADLERAREGRRGVLRVSQSEIERMFFGADFARGAADAVGDARALLLSGGIDSEQVDAWLEEISTVPFDPEDPLPGTHAVVSSILDELAFETAIDLDTARRTLVRAWAELALRGAGKGASLRPAPRRRSSSSLSGPGGFDPERSDLDPERSDLDSDLGDDVDPERSEIDPERSEIETERSEIDTERRDVDTERSGMDADRSDTRRRESRTTRSRTPSESNDIDQVLARLEARRRSGAPLEPVLRELEEKLSDAAEDDEAKEEDSPAPDFPGVVGAMIEEFLWEASVDSGLPRAHELEPVRSFGRFAQGIGVFENLTARELLEYTCFWLPEGGELENGDAARALLSALQAFCRWAEETHDVPLHTQFKATLGALSSSLPRTIEANRRRTRATDSSQGELHEVLDVDAETGRLRVGARDGTAHDATVDVHLAAWLQRGDRLRAHLHEDGRIAVYCCYPPESGALEAR